MHTPRLAQVFAIAVLTAASGAVGQQWITVPLHPSGHVSSVAAAAFGTAQGGSSFTGTQFLPVVWNSSSSSWMSLLPAGAGIVAGDVYAMSADNQAGKIGILGVGSRAALWSGTASSFVNLHPQGASHSEVRGLSGNKQGGWYQAGPGQLNRAALWQGTAQSMVDLHPPQVTGPNTSSEIHAMDGAHQFGFVQLQSGNQRAAMWSGTAQSWVDLGATVNASVVHGAGGGQQVGWANFGLGLGQHAALWTGTPESIIDLHPFPGYGGSRLFATTGEYQVGHSHIPGSGSVFPRAGLWNGTAASFLDLHQFLPPGHSDSSARSIQELNGQLYISGTAYSNATGQYEAWLWIGAIPAPGPAAAFLAAASLLATRRRRSP